MRAIVLPVVLLILGLSAGCGSSRGAVEGSGPATRNSGATVASISCAAPGECAAAGSYNSSKAFYQPLVLSQTNGSWGKAIEVPGMAKLNHQGSARLTSISCAAPGECAAGGYYYTGGLKGAFVVSETNGKWGNAIEAPGAAKLDASDASVISISCAAPGECAAGGNYDASGQPVVVSETNGSWGKAIEVPDVAKLSPGGYTTLSSISCAAAGECAAGGYYFSSLDGHEQAWVVSETNGRWGNAIEVPGTATRNTGGYAGVTSISCAAPGECAAGGHYADGSDNAEAFVVDETSSSWGTAIEVPGRATHGVGGAFVNSISCAAPGECAAGGYYMEHSGNGGALVVSETNGRWGTAIEVPGTATLKTGCKPSTRRCDAPAPR